MTTTNINYNNANKTIKVINNKRKLQQFALDEFLTSTLVTSGGFPVVVGTSPRHCAVNSTWLQLSEVQQQMCTSMPSTGISTSMSSANCPTRSESTTNVEKAVCVLLHMFTSPRGRHLENKGKYISTIYF